MDKIQGPGFTKYDSQHLQVSRRLQAESVKPNVFKEVDEDVARALLMTDLVALSPEAREILRKLKKHLDSRKERGFVEGKEEDFNSLLGGLKSLREAIYEQEEEEEENEGKGKKKKEKQLFQKKDGKYIIPLSGPQKTETSGTQASQTREAAGGSSRIRDIVESIVVQDAPSLQKSLVGRELEALGEKMITYVKSFGVHIIVLEKNSNLTQRKVKGMMIVAPGERTFDGRRWEEVRGIYCQDRRLIVVGEELLGMRNHSAIRHEFAHAFDHAFTSRNRRRLPLSVQLWNWFEKERKALPSQYAATNPAEYFAESVDAYFIPEGRAYLERNDPQMCEYLTTLFLSA
ncbi:MAG: hypothetical protein RDV48_22230 [Candidatus Eremiobacteraeota bacterium]|nr:hypothetical protein [Candidatus Eremiobacteraeota bacterium]